MSQHGSSGRLPETTRLHTWWTLACPLVPNDPARFSMTWAKQFVISCVARDTGYPSIVNYLDDFLVIGEFYGACKVILEKLLALLRHLGFAINYDKVAGPVQRITSMSLELPEQKLIELKSALREYSYIYLMCIRMPKSTTQIVFHCCICVSTVMSSAFAPFLNQRVLIRLLLHLTCKLI